MKYIVVTGGVLSGLGKGMTTSSIGVLLKSCGYKVTAIKIDPYLNCDAGTMNPYQHGEVFVLEDGGEVDLDLGNYERFLDTNLTSEHNITTGKIYRAVIEKERKGVFLGSTVQIIPHITNEILGQIKKVAENSGADIALIEIGGTVGDIESMPFLEAVRQLRLELGEKNVVFVHTTLVPIMGVVGEQKTKPTQHSVKELMSLGIKPDMIVCRCFEPLNKSARSKISLFCSVPLEAIFSAHDVEFVHQLPLLLHEQGATSYLLKCLGWKVVKPNLRKWRMFVNKILHEDRTIKIALVGKYTGLHDSYISHIKSLMHSGAETSTRVEIVWVDAEELERSPFSQRLKLLRDVHGIVVPGGFGKRGTEGKIIAIRHAREHKIPFLGICLGFQLGVVEFARHILKFTGANSTEFDPGTKYPVIDLLPEQQDIEAKGATMRLGAKPTLIAKGSIAYSLYGRTAISERHRHRYEVNPKYIDVLEAEGLKFSGRSPDGRLMEIGELPESRHPYFMLCQFHPEFKSRPGKPAPLYLGLVKAAIAYAEQRGD